MAVVNCEPSLLSLLNNISDLPREPPSLYLNLEGVRLGRRGSLSIRSMSVPRRKHTIDVQVLGSAAFSTTNSHGVSLKTILKSPHTPKVVFDIRNDSDALYSHYQISVDGVKDLQLMELASRTGSKDRVAGQR
jgi:exonuclease 3'-5' domain-containing protein 1